MLQPEPRVSSEVQKLPRAAEEAEGPSAGAAGDLFLPLGRGVRSGPISVLSKSRVQKKLPVLTLQQIIPPSKTPLLGPMSIQVFIRFTDEKPEAERLEATSRDKHHS